MSWCLIYGQIYILVVNPFIMVQVTKEENTRITQMISNKSMWYQFHAGTQGDLYGVTKDHYNYLKVILKNQRIRSFSSITYLQGHQRINGICYRWIWANHIRLP